MSMTFKLELIAGRDALQVGMTARVHAVEVAFDQDGNETHTVELERVEADPPEPAITDEMVDRAAEAIAYELVDGDATYWRPIARRTLEAALGSAA